MESKKNDAQVDKGRGAKDQQQQPRVQWKEIISGAWHDFSPGYLPNLLVSLIFLLITPAIGAVMNKPKIIIGGFALGLTVCVWLVAIFLMRHTENSASVERPASAPIPATPPPQTPTPAPTPALNLEQPTFREKTEVVAVSVGGMTTQYPYSRLASQEGVSVSPLSMAGFEPIRLHIKDGKLYADINTTDGVATVEIAENEFVVRPHDWDRNANQNALEVVDRNHRPVIQLIYESPTRIRINGVFVGNGITVFAAGDTIGSRPDILNNLKPIFKYPSWKYPGQFVE
jgi:hypothetical protein